MLDKFPSVSLLKFILIFLAVCSELTNTSFELSINSEITLCQV